MDHFSKAGAFYSSFELKRLTPCLHNLEAPTLPALHNYIAYYSICYAVVLLVGGHFHKM